jgi:hypothetical protein
MAGKSDFGDLAKKHNMRTPEHASYLHQQARDLEESGSIKDANDFLQQYGQVYLEVCGYSKWLSRLPNTSKLVILIAMHHFPIQNRLWKLPRCNIYATIMPDLLHQIKIGVWKHIMEWFKILLLHHYTVREANQYLDELDKRVSLVPHFTGIKSFTQGI